MAQKMINPAQYIAFIDTLNELEQKAKKIRRYGLPMDIGRVISEDFQDYSVEWDSMAARWTLVSETDDAPALCSFNQTAAECSETDLCEQCWQIAQANEDESDEQRAYSGN